MANPTPKSARAWERYQAKVREMYANYGGEAEAPAVFLRELDWLYQEWVRAKEAETHAHYQLAGFED